MRCFDLGGDKALPDEVFFEANPQLGWRAIRILLDRPELFRAQLRAIVRANERGNLRVMLPMIAAVEEVEASRALLDEVCRELGKTPPPLGAMIETPAAVAIAAHLAKRCDFLSIGTNDLMQYTLATDRENERVADRYDPFHPAVLAGIAHTAEVARAAGIPCAVCGELGGNPAVAPLLIGMGHRGALDGAVLGARDAPGRADHGRRRDGGLRARGRGCRPRRRGARDTARELRRAGPARRPGHRRRDPALALDASR